MIESLSLSLLTVKNIDRTMTLLSESGTDFKLLATFVAVQLVCVGPGRKPRLIDFSSEGSNNTSGSVAQDSHSLSRSSGTLPSGKHVREVNIPLYPTSI